MKSMFRGYYPPTQAEFDKLWTEGLIVLDTNSLLNLFRYSEATRDELLDLLKKEQLRVWIPHQVGLEFHRNRSSISREQDRAFDGVQKALDEAKTSVETAIDSLKRHPSQEADDLSALLTKHMRKISKGLREARERHTTAVLDEDAHKKTLDTISAIYEDRVGLPFSEERLKEVLALGTERYAKKIPPGFEDARKKDERQFGDLVLWLQLLEHATSLKKPAIFVTDDAKSDWWSRSSGLTHGPRPELVEEYYEASGERIHFYEPRRFLAYAQKRGEKISNESVEEARKVSTVAEFKFTASQNLALKRMLKRANQTLLESSEHDEMMARGRGILEQLDLNQVLPRSPRVDDFVREMADLGINHPARAQTLEAQEFMRAEARRLALLKRIVADFDEDQGKIHFNDQVGVFDDDGVPHDDASPREDQSGDDD